MLLDQRDQLMHSSVCFWRLSRHNRSVRSAPDWTIRIPDQLISSSNLRLVHQGVEGRGGHNALFQNLIMWASGYDYIANPKTFSLLPLFSRCHTAIAQGLSKYSGPLYMSKIKVSQSTSCGYSKLVSQEAWKDAKDWAERTSKNHKKITKIKIGPFSPVFGRFLSYKGAWAILDRPCAMALGHLERTAKSEKVLGLAI